MPGRSVQSGAAGKRRKNIMTKTSERTPLYEKLLKELKGQIVSGAYQKGDLLPSEKELIETYGMSRITVRKTLSILAEMGFIETSQGRGSVVLFSPENSKSTDDFKKAVDEYYHDFMSSSEIRLLLEPEIARKAALTASREQVAHLKAAMKGTGDSVEVDEFHRAIAEILNNQKLNDMMEELFIFENSKASIGTIQPERQDEISKVVEMHHQKIYEAIRDRNPEFAYFYMKEHTLYMKDAYEEYFKRMKE